MIWQQIRKNFTIYFSLGSILLLLGLFVLIIYYCYHPSIGRNAETLMIPWYLICIIIDYYFSHHLLFNQDFHQRLLNDENDLLQNRLDPQQVDQLIDWYAQWLALFTGTFSRCCDLCAFQIAGSFDDLLEFQRKHDLNFIDDTIAQQLKGQLNLADEQVFKVFYGSKIKRRAFRYLQQMHVYHREKYQSQYLDQLLDTYGKTYFEYGIFLIKRMRNGSDIRPLYEGLVKYHAEHDNAFIRQLNQHKMLLQSSVLSLKDVLQRKKP